MKKRRPSEVGLSALGESRPFAITRPSKHLPLDDVTTQADVTALAAARAVGETAGAIAVALVVDVANVTIIGAERGLSTPLTIDVSSSECRPAAMPGNNPEHS